MGITKRSRKLLKSLYTLYRDNLQNNQPLEMAAFFGGLEEIQRDALLTGWKREDISDACRELDRRGFLDVTYGDDEPQFIRITDVGIAYVEGTPFRVLEFLAKLLSFFS